MKNIGILSVSQKTMEHKSSSYIFNLYTEDGITLKQIGCFIVDQEYLNKKAFEMSFINQSISRLPLPKVPVYYSSLLLKKIVWSDDTETCYLVFKDATQKSIYDTDQTPIL